MFKRPQPKKIPSQADIELLVRQLKKQDEPAREGYRQRSLRLHGWVCAKCGASFDRENLHLLTVHHKDGNHQNNPRDGSNWENLCIYCHDDEHSRSLLASYISEEDS